MASTLLILTMSTKEELLMTFNIDVLRLHQKWGWLSNVMDFYNKNKKYNIWYESFEKENKYFLEIDDYAQQLKNLENQSCFGEFY